MVKTVAIQQYKNWQSNFVVIAEYENRYLLARHSLDDCGRSCLSYPFIREGNVVKPQEEIKLKGLFNTIEQLVSYYSKLWHTDTLRMVAEFTKTAKEYGLSKIVTAQLDKQLQKKLKKPTDNIEINDIVIVNGWPGRYRVVTLCRDFAKIEGIDSCCRQAGWVLWHNYGLSPDFRHYVHPRTLTKIQ